MKFEGDEGRVQLAVKERRSYHRILMGEDVQFGADSLTHSGTSYVFSPNGMSILADEVLPARSKIVIELHIKGADVVTVRGEVIWNSVLSNRLSIMGVNFDHTSEKLLQIYQSKTSNDE